MTHKLDKDLHIHSLFFAKTTSQKMLKLNNEVWLMDCIYKTNIYKMPLCIITRVTPLNNTYYIVFAILSAKMLHDYCWVLGTVRKLYEFHDILVLKVIVINADLSIICTILEEFSFASHLLCL